MMSDREPTICAHIPCGCLVAPGEKYCSDSCRDAGSNEVEVECECMHETCTMASESEKIA